MESASPVLEFVDQEVHTSGPFFHTTGGKKLVHTQRHAQALVLNLELGDGKDVRPRCLYALLSLRPPPIRIVGLRAGEFTLVRYAQDKRSVSARFQVDYRQRKVVSSCVRLRHITSRTDSERILVPECQ